MARQWQVYLSGEIHSDWREQIKKGAADLPVSFSEPVTDHSASDDCGVQILGPEDKAFWKDHKGAQLNAIRTRTLIGQADVVVVRFGRAIQTVERSLRCGLCGRFRQTAHHFAPRGAHPRAKRSRCSSAGRSERAPSGSGDFAVCDRAVTRAKKPPQPMRLRGLVAHF